MQSSNGTDLGGLRAKVVFGVPRKTAHRVGRKLDMGVKAVQAPEQRFTYSGLRFDPLNGGTLKADKVRGIEIC